MPSQDGRRIDCRNSCRAEELSRPGAALIQDHHPLKRGDIALSGDLQEQFLVQPVSYKRQFGPPQLLGVRPERKVRMQLS